MASNFEFYTGGDAAEVLGTVLRPSALKRVNDAFTEFGQHIANDTPALYTPEAALRPVLSDSEFNVATRALQSHLALFGEQTA